MSEDTRLEPDKFSPLCYAAGNLPLCYRCYRNPENRKPAIMEQDYVCGAVSYSKGEYLCDHYAEMPMEIMIDLEE